jgi:hypothetical protein
MTDHKNDQTLINLVVEDLKDSITQEDNTENSNKYVVLMETSGEECESWYYCIKYDGNEKNLEYLHKQLESIDWYILDDLSTFDLDLDHFISEQTAKELTKLELNHYSFHRKFDGVLDKIELNLRNKDENEKKMVKVFDVLGYGRIEEHIGDEDIDEEDLTDGESSSGDESSDDDSNIKSLKQDFPVILQKSNIPLYKSKK